jgi:hypothetical protein
MNRRERAGAAIHPQSILVVVRIAVRNETPANSQALEEANTHALLTGHLRKYEDENDYLDH